MFAWQATVQDDRGNVVVQPSVTVYLSDGVTVADIYEENGDPKLNPFLGTDEGFVQFWADAGRYRIFGAKGGDQTEEWIVDIGYGNAEIVLDTAFGAVGRTLDTLTYDVAGVVAGAVVRAGDTNALYEVMLSGAADPDFTGAGGVRLQLIGPWRSSSLASSADFAAAVRRHAADLVVRGDLLHVRSGETVHVPCDPSTQDLAAYMRYMAAGHSVEPGGVLRLEIADGLHNVSTVIDISNTQRVDITAAGDSHTLNIASISYALQSGSVWRATITVSGGTLPAYLTEDCVVGVQNPVGDGTPDAAAMGMIVVERHSPTSISCDIQARGVVPLVNMTTPTSGTSLGMAQNKLIVPRTCIRFDSAAWTPGGVGNVEGAINARNGSRVHIYNVGLAYKGTADGHEMLFARDTGSVVYMGWGSVLAGDCTILTRSAYGGTIQLENCFLGLGIDGHTLWQGLSSNCVMAVVRAMLGGGSSEMISATAACSAFLTQCVLTGAAMAARPTYPSAVIDLATCRVRHCATALQPTRGTIYASPDTTIERCTTPMVITGANYGRVDGNPAMSGNTNAAPTPNAIQSNGAVWTDGAGKPYDPAFYKVGTATATMDFPSITAGGFAEFTVALPGAAFGQMVLVERATTTMPAQGIMYDAFVSAAGTVTVRCINHSTGTIDPTAATIRVAVIAVA